MTRDKLVDLTGTVLMVIFAFITSLGLLYGYTQMSQKDKDLIFWLIITQPQE